MVNKANNNIRIYTVSQVNLLIKAILENNLPPRLAVAGEISDWRHHQSGHCYFLLKDDAGQLPCVMWASKFRKVKFAVENGMAVVVKGHVDVYTPGGKYQFYAESIQPKGFGALWLAYEQLKKRLGAEGLFDDAHKKPLPPYPQRIGIVTSESGAAVHDIRNSIWARWPCARLFLYPVPVQGEGAAEKIAAALRDINRRNKELKLDILIVARGGGSLEDLWAFNEEVLARAIYDSQIPVISAVGHEVDTTIADLVADKRASTPTKAGVVAVPDKREVLAQLAYFEKSLSSKAQWKFQWCEKSLREILASAVFRNPLLAVRDREQQLDELAGTLADLVRGMVAKGWDRLRASYDRVAKIEPHRLLAEKTIGLSNLSNRANTAARAVINKGRIQLTAQENRLAGLNPKKVLQRGYSITTNRKTGLLVRTLEDIEVTDLLITELAGENFVESKVTSKHNKGESTS